MPHERGRGADRRGVELDTGPRCNKLNRRRCEQRRDQKFCEVARLLRIGMAMTTALVQEIVDGPTARETAEQKQAKHRPDF